MLSVTGLSKSFNHRKILDNLSFQLKFGETAVFMGNNGAGKTTLLRIIARIMTPDKGEIIFENINILTSQPSSRKNILYIGHAPAMYASLSALENLKFALEIRKNKLAESKIIYQLEHFGLLEQANDPISFFSQGMLQRLKLTYAELSNWNLLLLDEPFSGLDKEGEEQMDLALSNWQKKGKSICLVLHNIVKAKIYGDKTFNLLDGKIYQS
ncbi:heme ABC exporter ATP-binding protein CcmA [Candidatus Marinimicrobia bacterium]|jgi:ABC-2 type transport system ATP-binding protein|nr:heme ABC exporter ATP-binding protein CcmA [Candidatus Neomarinimicrobiota bacterium]